jgi:hypothetical protein
MKMAAATYLSAHSIERLDKIIFAMGASSIVLFQIPAYIGAKIFLQQWDLSRPFAGEFDRINNWWQPHFIRTRRLLFWLSTSCASLQLLATFLVSHKLLRAGSSTSAAKIARRALTYVLLQMPFLVLTLIGQYLEMENIFTDHDRVECGSEKERASALGAIIFYTGLKPWWAAILGWLQVLAATPKLSGKVGSSSETSSTSSSSSSTSSVSAGAG